MNELKCPNCGHYFTVDEADYESIVNQVRNAEFEKELKRRLEEAARTNEANNQLFALKAEKKFEERMAARDREEQNLKNQIELLKQQLEISRTSVRSEYELKMLNKEKEISELHGKIRETEAKVEVAVMKREKNLVDTYEKQLKEKDVTLQYYKDLKTRLSTKMLGETLETHCSASLNQMRPLFPNAYFEKDNEVVEGTKGDFIFRDYEDGIEYVSVMFEMKNEADTTAAKHRNEDFLKKLDEDRRKKNCEFAVLVSLLEPDNELYNNGIVDMSHRYQKMYVIRPQFFMPIITLLVQTSKKSIQYKKELLETRSRNIDITGFEEKLEKAKTGFSYNYNLASKKFGDAIKEIDNAIRQLQKTRDDLVGSENNLRLANEKLEDLTIRKLTWKNPTMKEMFEDERKFREGRETDSQPDDQTDTE